jgi:hypothetical protein
MNACIHARTRERSKDKERYIDLTEKETEADNTGIWDLSLSLRDRDITGTWDLPEQATANEPS